MGLAHSLFTLKLHPLCRLTALAGHGYADGRLCHLSADFSADCDNSGDPGLPLGWRLLCTKHPRVDWLDPLHLIHLLGLQSGYQVTVQVRTLLDEHERVLVSSQSHVPC